MFPNAVISATTTSQPSSPSAGDAYIVPAAGWGSMHGNMVATFTASWSFEAPVAGLQLFVQDSKLIYAFDGANWKSGGKVLASLCVDLATAAAAAATAGVDLEIDIPCSITAALSLPATITTVVFTGTGRISGAYSVTFNGNAIIAAAAQIFQPSGTAAILGTIVGDICFDWWGTTSATYSDPATTNAINAAFNYIVQSGNPSCTVHGYKPVYYLSDTITKPSSEFCPNITFHGAVIRTDFSVSKPALNIIGVSGNPALAVISDIQLEATSGHFKSIGLQITGQCGVDIQRVTARQHAYSFILCNSAPGIFTEFVRFSSCSSASAITLRYQRLNGGDASFHGSGIESCLINPAENIDALILVDDGAFVYNAPMSFAAFPNSLSYPLIRTGLGARWITYGDMTVENFWGSGTLTLLSTTSNQAHTHSGSINCWGGAYLTGGLTLFETTYILVDGITRGRKKGFQPPAASIPGATTSVLISSNGSTTYLLNLFINTTNYFWKGIVAVSSDPFGGNSTSILATMLTGGANYSSWGPPSFGWNGDSVTINNANFGAAGQVEISVTDLGDFF